MSNQDDEQQMSDAPNPVKIQESLLRRAQVLKGNIDSFQRQIETANPLSSYPSMYGRLMTLRDAINEFMEEAQNNRQLLSTIALTPTMQFPTRYQADLLGNMLRTKMEPNVEDWEQQQLKAAQDREKRIDQQLKTGTLSSFGDQDRAELWEWAAEASQTEIQIHPWFSADYTLAEKESGIEHVRHGLRRELVVPESPDSGDDDDDDEDELFQDVGQPSSQNPTDTDMDVDSSSLQDKDRLPSALHNSSAPVRKPMALDTIHRFMTKGETK